MELPWDILRVIKEFANWYWDKQAHCWFRRDVPWGVDGSPLGDQISLPYAEVCVQETQYGACEEYGQFCQWDW